jgi:hypothetical protein
MIESQVIRIVCHRNWAKGPENSKLTNNIYYLEDKTALAAFLDGHSSDRVCMMCLTSAHATAYNSCSMALSVRNSSCQRLSLGSMASFSRARWVRTLLRVAA